MTWVLTICIAGGWFMCGHELVREYPTEAQCYKALDTLHHKYGRSNINYALCSPKNTQQLENTK